MKKTTFTFLWALFMLLSLNAQSIYYVAGTPAGSNIWQLDLGSCTPTQLYTGITPQIRDLVEAPSGFFLLRSTQQQHSANVLFQSGYWCVHAFNHYHYG